MAKRNILIIRVLFLLSTILFLVYFYNNNNNNNTANKINNKKNDIINNISNIKEASSSSSSSSKDKCDNVEMNVDNNHRDKHIEFWNNMTPRSLELLNHGWKEFVTKEQVKLKEQETKDRFELDSRGIVFVAGNDDTIKRTLGTIRYIRFKLNSTLSIEIWHMEHESDAVQPFKEVLEKLDATLCDLSDYHLVRPMTRKINAAKQFQVKAAAIINSKFHHVLYLDSDNTPTKDPSFLFDTKVYNEFGAIFWPDFWKTAKENKIFDLLEIDCQDQWEQESGQIVVDKKRHWIPLQLSWYMQFYQQVYFNLLNGDKDTFQYAWRALDQPFYMIKELVGMGGYNIDDNKFCGHTMLQYFDGHIMFVHANLMKQIPNHASPKWEIIKRTSENNGNSEVIWPIFKMVDDIGCMDYHQTTTNVKLETFEEVLPGFSNGYFEMGGLAGFNKKM